MVYGILRWGSLNSLLTGFFIRKSGFVGHKVRFYFRKNKKKTRDLALLEELGVFLVKNTSLGAESLALR